MHITDDVVSWALKSIPSDTTRQRVSPARGDRVIYHHPVCGHRFPGCSPASGSTGSRCRRISPSKSLRDADPAHPPGQGERRTCGASARSGISFSSGNVVVDRASNSPSRYFGHVRARVFLCFCKFPRCRFAVGSRIDSRISIRRSTLMSSQCLYQPHTNSRAPLTETGYFPTQVHTVHHSGSPTAFRFWKPRLGHLVGCRSSAQD